MTYESFIERESQTTPGVIFVLAKMSFGRRIELTRQIREIAAKVEFLEAGEDPRDKIEGALLSSRIDRLYLLWGLKEVRGLDLDGVPATPESLAAIGPEELFREALESVRAECGLTESERKN